MQRLDPAVMHVSCIQAGMLLARLGRPEVTNCIAGLVQYKYSYEETGDHVQEIKRVYNAAKSGEFDFNHMSSFALGETPVEPVNSMAVDAPESSPPTSVRCHPSWV